MAKRQFITLTAMLLFAATAHADILPRWGDRSCTPTEEYHCVDLFPLLEVDFSNPLTGASTREELRFVGNGYFGLRFLAEDTERYRIDTGCITCDLYEGIILLMNTLGEFDHPADVYAPFGFSTDVDTGQAVMAFDGAVLRIVQGPIWEGWTADGLTTFLNMSANQMWYFETLTRDGDHVAEARGDWSIHRDSPSARVSTDEPPALWLLLSGVLLLGLHLRLSRA